MPATVRSMLTIHLSYTRLLHEVCEQLHLAVPHFVAASNSDGQFVSSMDLQIPRTETVTETVRCESTPFPTYAAAEQDVVRRALRRLKDECDLQVQDVNYEDSVVYKSLYDHQLTDYALLFSQFNNLTREYNILKECYLTTLAQKNEYINERVMLRQAIGECHDALNRLTVEPPPTTANPSDAMSNQPA
ncbi:uncharacterized protein LOC109727892 isoform X1 [Ananas comosus]|uniref:Uncharacterized protein LOC109727892 isoform X1 n=2 Tax=Ananas comosus TaxID=4615 RepID=A0A6P5GYD7_ANACO|nr:uncharacterized protein LOC109727892 isoform X1 [Ananas comosus]XP_020113687.1 uncharacterized protein LOC109727892 isoform X1 [Ananas comosus]